MKGVLSVQVGQLLVARSARLAIGPTGQFAGLVVPYSTSRTANRVLARRDKLGASRTTRRFLLVFRGRVLLYARRRLSREEIAPDRLVVDDDLVSVLEGSQAKRQLVAVHGNSRRKTPSDKQPDRSAV